MQLSILRTKNKNIFNWLFLRNTAEDNKHRVSENYKILKDTILPHNRKINKNVVHIFQLPKFLTNNIFHEFFKIFVYHLPQNMTNVFAKYYIDRLNYIRSRISMENEQKIN